MKTLFALMLALSFSSVFAGGTGENMKSSCADMFDGQGKTPAPIESTKAAGAAVNG